MQAFCALFFATFSLAQANVQFPDIGKAKVAAENVFQVIDREPKIDAISKVNGWINWSLDLLELSS